MADAKGNKLKARLPRGLADRAPTEIAATRRMTETIRKVYELYGFEPVETPMIEYTDALGKFLPDQDRPNEGVFSFQDDDEQWLSLRYDLTAPLARYVADNFDTLPKPYRSYRAGYVYRNEKPGPGRFRQFMQFDADTVGSSSMAADAEICMMAADTMEALGIPRGSYVVKVWNRKLLDGMMDAFLELRDAPPEKRLTVLRAIDKSDRLGMKGVQLLLGEGRKDDSGDFTKGAGLTPSANNVITISSSLGTTAPLPPFVFSNQVLSPSALENFESCSKFPFNFTYFRQNTKELVQHTGVGDIPAPTQAGLAELDELSRLISEAGYEDRIKIDPSVVRGLEYYTGPVYEIELTLPIIGDDGKPVRFGSVGGGGRYDGLVSRFRVEPVPATGFSIGVSRLLAALMQIGTVDAKPEPGPVIVTVFDKDRLADYQRMASTLRQAGVRAELYLGSGKFGPQMKYADRRRSPCVVIQGTDEKQKGEVQIKDLIVGAELAGLSKERDDYLKKQADAQFAVPEDQLVDAVRKVLARHGVNWE
jgi:histidyl-tRNA synthetase